MFIGGYGTMDPVISTRNKVTDKNVSLPPPINLSSNGELIW